VDNRLTLGELRSGSLCDYDDSTPETQVVLERRPEGICTTISWTERNSPYASWFWPATGGTQSAGSPDRLAFRDSRGEVQLIGCRAQGFHASLHGAGSGRVWAKYAVMDAKPESDYRSVHGLRTHISGLPQWLGSSGWAEEWEAESPRLRGFTMVSVPEVELGEWGGVTVRLIPRARWQRQPDGALVLDSEVLLETNARGDASWETHLSVHRALRSLLVLSRWRPETVVPVEAHRIDDPEVAYGGSPIGSSWRRITTAGAAPTDITRHYVPHLIPLIKLNGDGVIEWLRLYAKCRRALGPVVTAIDLAGISGSSALAHIGPGLEALGHHIRVDQDNLAQSKARNTPLVARLERIAHDVKDVLPFDGVAWATTTANSYNGIKHVNRDWPSDADIWDALSGSIVVSRAWAALKLGLDAEHVKDVLDHNDHLHWLHGLDAPPDMVPTESEL
jgi:hypothetical protein